MASKHGPQLGIPFEDPVKIWAFLNELPSRKMAWLGRIHPVCLLVLEHRYGLNGCLPVRQRAWEPEFEPGRIYYFRELALCLLGFDKRYLTEVIERAERLKKLERWRLNYAFKLATLPTDWDATRRAIAEACLNDCLEVVARRFGISNDTAAAICHGVERGELEIKMPSHQERPAVFTAQLVKSSQDLVWVGPRERVIQEGLRRLAMGEPSSRVAAAFDTTASYVRCLPVAARLDLNFDKRWSEGSEAKFDRNTLAVSYPSYRQFVRQFDQESLTPLEREFARARVSGENLSEAAKRLRLKVSEAGTYVELLMLDAFTGSNQRGKKISFEVKLARPLIIQLEPWGEFRNFVERFRARSASLPRGEVDKSTFPVTSRQWQWLEVMRAAVDANGYVHHPMHLINEAVEKPLIASYGSAATQWLRRYKFLVLVSGGTVSGKFNFIDRPTRVVENKLARVDKIARRVIGVCR